MSRHKTAKIALILLIVAVTVAIVAGTKPIEWVEAKYSSGYEKAEVAVTAAVLPQKDNVDKLTEHLEQSLRDLENARATLDRAKQALRDADDLHTTALDEFNTSAEYLNTYAQGL